MTTAWALIERGAHDVTVLERGAFACEASGVNAGSIGGIGWGHMPNLESHLTMGSLELFKQLQAVRRQGYAVDDEEARIGLRCVAAVVYNDCSEPLAAISVSGMTRRLTDDRLPAIGRTVREVAAELTVALGGVMPDAADGDSAKGGSGHADSTFSSR